VFDSWNDAASSLAQPNSSVFASLVVTFDERIDCVTKALILVSVNALADSENPAARRGARGE
jgi:hypothetical protein